ncbi:right-handed parallel beta-helix repeat-containing protein [Pontiellaceae bacterium B1224]|nr:right-handed parallel beta-helix repeat-containing protein [Pontiellaceae bacterium B1224]
MKLQILSLLAWLTTSALAISQTTVTSPADLLPYLDDDNVHVKLAPGTYSVSAEDVEKGTYSNPLFKFTGSNSTFDFTGVTINFSTDLMRAFGKEDVHQIRIEGNKNILKNLTMVDVGTRTDRPTWRATNLVMDGSHNRVEGFHMTVKGSWPYGYGDAFGKGRTHVIAHFKHCGLLIRGESNHVKDCTMIHQAYGHGIYMQAANNPIIEGCYVEGEIRKTDDMLAEKGTGSPADEVDFKTVWGGRKLQPGFMKSLQEEGIRAYNGGDTVIDGKTYERGTSNVTVLNCTIKQMRGGVTLTHAKGKKYVEGCTAIGCERGYAIGSGDIVDCRGDALYGPVFGVDYKSDSNITADITVLSNEGAFNGDGLLAKIIGKDHNITFRCDATKVDPSLPISIDESSNIEIHNLTLYPLNLGSDSSGTTGESQGKIKKRGSNNKVEKI